MPDGASAAPPPALPSGSVREQESVMAEHRDRNGVSAVLAGMGELLPRLEALHEDLHAHPELAP